MAVPVWATNDVPSATDFNVWLTNMISAIKTANESVTSSTALQNDDQLVLPAAINSTYFLYGLLVHDGATAGDLKFDFTGPAGASIFLQVSGLNLSAAATTDDALTLIETFGDVAHIGLLGAGSHTTTTFTGNVAIAGTAGSVQLRWAQEASSATATRILTGSIMYMVRIS